MRLTVLRRLLFILAIIIACKDVSAQNCFNTGLNNSSFNLACGVTCYTRPIQVPDIRSTDNYVVSQGAYLPFPTHAGTEISTSNEDDVYSSVLDLPFRFCFFDSVYEKIVVGSNGIVTFDERRAGEVNAYTVDRPIPYAGGSPNLQNSNYYPPASIMGVFQDLDPTQNTANRRIEYATYGVAPCRKFVISFYEMSFYTGSTCAGLTNTTQIVLFESTGIIEVQVGNKSACNLQDGGRAILGIQNWDRNIGITPPGRNSAVWSETNTAYRFTPSGGSSRFISSEAFLLDGTSLGVATSANTTPGLVDLTFPGLCPTVSGTRYVIRNTFSSCDNAAVTLVNNDTITINLTTSLQATVDSVASDCGAAGNGQIIVRVPAGIGTAPYNYVLDGAAPVSGGNTHTFIGVTAGIHTVVVTDASGCSSNFSLSVGNTGVLNATVTTVAATCTGALNGSITVNVPNGNATTQYSLGGSPWQTNNVFTGLNPGVYFLQVRHGTCISPDFITAIVGGGTSTITGTITAAATTCAGVNNGSITVTPTSGPGTYQYSINGGAWQSSNVFNGLAPDTYQIRIRLNGLCQSAIILATVTAGGGLQATLTQTSTACTGISTGTITVTPTNGVGPYRYAIDGGTPVNAPGAHTFTNLSAGAHAVTITDNIGCVTATPLNITVTTAVGFTATATTVATACPGVNNGRITITPSAAAVTPITYSLDGGTAQASATFNSVASGTHSVLVRDGNGCEYTVANISVTSGSGILATLTQTPTACSGVSTGTVTVTPTNGAGPYRYVIDGGTPINAAGAYTFTNLAAGSHSVTITDNIGCVTTTPLTITVGTAAGFTATATTVATACPGVNNGRITITPSATAVAPITYSLDGGTAQSSPIFNRVSSGTHAVLVRDGNSCEYTVANINVATGSGILATLTQQPTACTGVNTGRITVTPTNGVGPYSYVLDGGAPITTAGAYTFTDLAAGAHSITITDNIGCVTTTPLTITVGTAAGFTATATTVEATCTGVNNGSITVTTSAAAAAPIAYFLDGGIIRSSAVFNGVSAGIHTILVRDGNGCEFTISNINVGAGAGITATTTTQATSCNTAGNGGITIVPTNGTAPYTYSLDGGAAQNSNIFTNVSAGVHTVVVRDALGCTGTLNSIAVSAGPALTTTSTQQAVTCNGGNTGRITVNQPTMGNAPYQYSLNGVNWQTSNVFTGLTANNYTVYYREQNGCEGQHNVTITQPVALSITTNVTAVLCNGNNNGVITVTATGGNGGYRYSLDNVNWQSSNTFNVVAGTYTVYVEDVTNCGTNVNNIRVSEPAVLTCTITNNTPATCEGGNNGAITIAAVGGTAPYRYGFENGTLGNNATLNNGPGTYNVVIRDANNCTFVINNVIIGLNNNLTFTPMTDPAVICEGTSTQLAITSNATGYAWTSTSGLSNSAIANPLASPRQTTTYTVQLTLGRCTATDDVVVRVNAAPIPNAGPDGDICFGQDYQLAATGGTRYNWSPATYLSDVTSATAIAQRPNATITYTLSVSDANGCSSLVTDAVTVKVTPPLRVITTPKDTIVPQGVTVALQAITLSQQTNLPLPQADLTYTWTPMAGLNNANIATPLAIAGVVGDVAVYRVTARSTGGCEGVGEVTIRVYKGPELYTPNAFTPNGDGKNDRFFPFPVGIEKLNYFRVLNRWGQVVFSTTTLHDGWDGRFKGIEQNSGAYVWMAEGITTDGQKITKKGSVTLIR